MSKHFDNYNECKMLILLLKGRDYPISFHSNYLLFASHFQNKIEWHSIIQIKGWTEVF